MAKYVCTVCGYIYDEAVGEPDNGIAAGTKWEDLPKAAQDYVLFIEKEIGVHISIVSTGPKRHEVIYR